MILIGIFGFWTLDGNVLKTFLSSFPLRPTTFSVTFCVQMKVLFFGAQGWIHHSDLYSRAERTLNSYSSTCCLGLAKLRVRCALVVGRCFAFSQDRAVEWGTSVPAPKGKFREHESYLWFFFFCISLNHLVLRIQPLTLKYIQTLPELPCAKPNT